MAAYITDEHEAEEMMRLDQRIVTVINLHIAYYLERMNQVETEEEKVHYLNRVKFYLGRRLQLYGH